MLRRLTVVAASVLLLSSCSSGAGSDERQVLVDFSYDDFATFVAANFPERVEITPGQTVVFKQTWTGEPHTVTGGAAVNAQLKGGKQWLEFFNDFEELIAGNEDMINPDDPGDATIADFAASIRAAKPAAKSRALLATYRELREIHPDLPSLDDPSDQPFAVLNDAVDRDSESAFEGLPFAFNEETDNIAQNVGHECYLTTGMPPQDPGTACTEQQQRQPAFDGTQSFYNSGILPYDGPRGNTYEVEFADDTKPGSYFFYCAIHGLGQLSEIVVRPKGTDVPSATEVARAGRREALETSKPLERVFRNATRTGKVEVGGEEVTGPFAGLPSDIHGAVDEFVPRTLRAKVNEPITWKFMGSDHSVSFDVPAYLPIIEFGTRIQLNPKVSEPAGGAPAIPERGEDDEGVLRIDGGTYDGTGFWSSGLLGAQPWAEYTLRISKAGTYNYACLIHPRMVGKVIVS